jgi:hypothetical protein
MKNPSDELRRHAIECGEIAHSLRNKKNRAAWNSIAERYLRCAQSYDTSAFRGGSPERPQATQEAGRSTGCPTVIAATLPAYRLTERQYLTACAANRRGAGSCAAASVLTVRR